MPLSAAEHEAIIANGQCAYSVSWDTGSPFGGSGCWKVCALNGVYAVSLDDGEGTGPYSSLREAIVATLPPHRTKVVAVLFVAVWASSR